MKSRQLAALVATIALFCAAPALAQTTQPCPTCAKPPVTTPEDESNHEGYYFPKVTSTELYKSRARQMQDTSRQQRLAFVSTIAAEMATNPYPAPFVLFAKGDDAEKLIIVGLQDGRLDTIYRARALFAQLTALLRPSKLFADFGVTDLFTFYDFARLIGFTQITVTDGKSFTHRITLE
jgi:hypothetical protein